jgi:hypothetical protein
MGNISNRPNAGGTFPPHAGTHQAGRSDALPWGTIHGYGSSSLRPTASSFNLGYLYFETDTLQLYRSNGIDWDLLTQSGGAIGYGLLIDRPTATSLNSGNLYYATDVYLLYRSNGSFWDALVNEATNVLYANSVYPLLTSVKLALDQLFLTAGPVPLTSTQIAYGNGSNFLTGSSNFVYKDNLTTGGLSILNTTSAASLITGAFTGALTVAGGVGISKELYIGVRTGSAINYAGFDIDGKLVETSSPVVNQMRFYAETIGTGIANPISIVHGLGTTDLAITVERIASGNIEYPTITIVDLNTISIRFSVIPTLNQFRVIIFGSGMTSVGGGGGGGGVPALAYNQIAYGSFGNLMTSSSALTFDGSTFLTAGLIKTSNTTVSVSTSTGSGVFGGGVGIAGNVNIGGTLNLPSQTANYVYASPNGLAGTPTFRALVAADCSFLTAWATKTYPTDASGLLRNNGSGTLSWDTNTYLTANQSITLSGDVTGSGTTSISTTVGSLKSVSIPTLATGYLYYNGSAFSWAAAGGFTNPMSTLGDIIYGGASGTATSLAGNITTTKRFLTQTGTGTVSAAPAWGTISSSDVSGLTAWATKAYPTDAVGLLRSNGSGTLSWDTNAYLTTNQTITLSSDVTGSGTTSITTTISAGAVSLSKMANLAANSIVGNNTASPATPQALSASQVKTLLSIASGDVSGLTAWATKTYPTDANGLLRNNGSGTLSWDTNTYLTANQSITLSGDVTGSGTTSISTTVGSLKNVSVPTLATGYLYYNGSAFVWQTPSPGFANPMSALGDTIYGGASGTATSLAGNITTTKKFLVQTGTGTVSAAPTWGTISSSDISGLTAWATKAYPTNASGTLTNDGSGNLSWSAVAASGPITSSGLTMNTARLLGRTTALAGTIEEITVGNGLSFSSGTLSATGFANPMSALGDTIYGGASGTATSLAGNITTTKRFLTQTGTGTVSAAPTWGTISSGDVSGLTAWATKAYPTDASGLLRNNGSGTLSWDTNTYLTANQSITLSGDVTGSGTTSISTTVGSLKNVSIPTLATGYLYYNGSAFSWAAGGGGFANPMSTLGDIIYGGASGTATSLAGNITTTKKFLVQTGTGTVSAAPTWGTISSSDVSGTFISSSMTMNTARLLGRTTTSAGAVEEISIGTNLTLSGGVLNATGGSGTPGGTTGQVQYNNGGAFGGIAEGTTGQVLLSNGAGVPPSFGTVSSGSGGGGWGSSSQLTMTQQTTGLTAGSAVGFTSTTGDHSLSNYQVTLKAGTKSELSAELFVVYNAGTSNAVYQWYNVTANAYIGNPSTEVPGNWTGSNATYTNQIKALITVASDTVVELRIKTIGAGTILSIETDSWAFVSSTLPQSANTASDTYTASDATTITTSTSQSVCDLTCGNVASGLYTVDGRYYNNNTGNGGVKLQASSDGGTNWTDLDWLGTHLVAPLQKHIQGTYKHNQALGTLKFRLYYLTEGASITFGNGSDARFSRKITATGPINSPSFGGGWGKSGMLGLSADQTTGLTVNSPVLFDTATGDFTVSGGSVVIKGGSKAELVFGGLMTNANGTSSVDLQWYNVTTSSWEGSICTMMPVTISSGNYGSSQTALASVNPASDTTYQVRIKAGGTLTRIYGAGYTWAKISATTPTGGAWAKSSQLLLASGQTTNLALNDPVKFAVVNGDHLLSNYAVTVKGGSVAMLRGNASGGTVGASSYGTLQWYDMAANAYIGNATEFLPLSLSGNSIPGAGATARVSPVNDTNYQLRINYLSGAGAITAIQNANATVESTDPMWPTAGGWTKSSQLTLSATQTTGLTVGSPVQFNTVAGDHTLSSYGVTVKGGSVAMLTAGIRMDMSGGSATAYASYQWYNVTTGAYEGPNVVMFLINDSYTQSNATHVKARVSPTNDSVYQLRIQSIPVGTIINIYNDSWATVESTDPNPPKGGNWALSSLVTLGANQTTNLTVGSPIRFDTISGDHTLSNYRVKVKGGQKAELIANVLGNFSGTSGYINTQWYNYTTSALVGKQGTCVSVSQTGHYGPYTPAITLETPSVDTEYELRVTNVGQIISVDAGFTTVLVNSTLPNASVTSQVIKKETVATNTTAWTVTLPVACKVVRVSIALNNATSSVNIITLGVNGTSTGHRQYMYSLNGGTPTSGEDPSPILGALRANGAIDRDFTLKISDSETRFNAVGGDFSATDSLSTFTQYMRIAQSADISSITFTGSQASGIGAGSYIIVERVDADLSQDLGWQDYTPTCYIDLTSATTVPNITPSVRYRVQGKTLFMQGTLNFTGAPTGATDLSISLPTGVNVVSQAAASKFTVAGSASFYDSSVGVSGVWQGRVRLPLSTENTGRVSFRAQTAISTIAGVAPTVPFTWATGDQLEFDFFTEIQ